MSTEDTSRIVLWRAILGNGSYDTSLLPFPATAAVQAGARQGFWTTEGSTIALTDKLLQPLNSTDNSVVWATLAAIFGHVEADLTVPLPKRRDTEPWLTITERFGSETVTGAMKMALGERLLRLTDDGIVCNVEHPAPAPSAPTPSAPGIERVQPQPYDQLTEGLLAPIPHRPKAPATGTSPLGNSPGTVAGGSITADPSLLSRAVHALEVLADQAGSPMTPVTPVGDSPILDCARELAVLMHLMQPATRHNLRERVRSRLRMHTSAALEMGVSKGAFTLVGSPVRGGTYSLSDPEVLGMDWSVIRSLAAGRKPARQLVSTSS